MKMSVLIENEEEEEDEADDHENSTRRGAVQHKKKENLECPSPATLGKNIDNIIVKNKQNLES